jgi:hypothetical protein
MRKLLAILGIVSGFSCNPYQSYYFTHYHMSAGYDPGSTLLSASVQMVFVPGQTHRDSIVFRMNGSMDIQALTAQELKHYTFDKGRLVLYIKEEVGARDQLHISLAYEGRTGMMPEGGTLLPTDWNWYPVHPDIRKMTYDIELGLPETYGLEKPWIRRGESWHWESDEPLPAIVAPRLKGL